MPFANLPLSELIDRNIQTTLAGVTTGNGYQITLSPARFPDPSGQTSPADMMCIIYVGDDEIIPDDDSSLGMRWYRRTYAIQTYIIKSPANLATTRFETWKNVVRAEIEKALMVDVNRGLDANSNPLAQNTEVGAPITFEDANDAQGIFVIVTVTYATNDLDPYSQTESIE